MKRKVWVLTVLVWLSFCCIPCEASASEKTPFSLDPPENLAVEVKYDQNNWAYFAITLDVPESVQEINDNLSEDFQHYSGVNAQPIRIRFDARYGAYDWNQGPSLYSFNEMTVDDLLGGNIYKYYPYEEKDVAGGINVEAEIYSFQAYFYSAWGNINNFINKEVRSPYSNLVSLGNPSEYRGASAWAKPGLDKALGYGFITDRIRDNMSGFITREEFAELAVQLYELYTGKQAQAAPTSTFTDTENPKVLKAHALGIVVGIGQGKFAPEVLINREQMAAMLYRAVETLDPDADMSVIDAPSFADEKKIAPYFVTNVKFVAKHGFLGDIGNNQFAPKASSTREQAVVAAVEIYEKYAGVTD